MNEGAMGGKGADVISLRLGERISIDPVRVLRLRRELGDAGAAEVMRRAFEGLSQAMARLEGLRDGVEEEDFHRAARQVARLSAQVGLNRLSAVAGDLAESRRAGDATAEGAVWARLRRLADAVLGQPGLRQGGRG